AFFFQAEDGIRDFHVTGVQTCALPIYVAGLPPASGLDYRLVLTAVFVPLGVHHLWRYARRVKADPSTSLVADAPPPPIERPGTEIGRAACRERVQGAARGARLARRAAA